MRFIFLILFFCSLIIFPASSQELVIKDSLKGKERVFKLESKFLFMTSDNQEYNKGKLMSLTDTSVVLYMVEEENPVEKVIPVKNIIVVRKATKLQYTFYAIGGLFLLNGVYFTLEGPSLRNRGLGVLSFAAGLIPFFFTPKTYEMGDRYRIFTRNTHLNFIPENKSTDQEVVPNQEIPDEKERITVDPEAD